MLDWVVPFCAKIREKGTSYMLDGVVPFYAKIREKGTSYMKKDTC